MSDGVRYRLGVLGDLAEYDADFGLTRALAMDVAAWGITVNAIAPGALDTSRSVLSLDPDLDVRAEMAQRGRRLPVGRVGRPEDVAAAVSVAATRGGRRLNPDEEENAC